MSEKNQFRECKRGGTPRVRDRLGGKAGGRERRRETCSREGRVLD